MQRPKKLAQFSFIGFDPRLVITAKDGRAEIPNLETKETIRIQGKDPLKVVKSALGKRQPYRNLQFVGGAVGLGFSKPEHVKTVIRFGADAAIVGSGFMKIIEQHSCKEMLKALKEYTYELKGVTAKNFRNKIDA